MGSLLPLRDRHELQELNVLVTGFGPFFDNTTNPSFLIAKSLPKTHLDPALPNRKINIHTLHTPIEVAYRNVRKIFPSLLFTNPSKPDPEPYSSLPRRTDASKAPESNNYAKYDIVLNIGLAAGRPFFALETVAHRSGYARPDVHDCTFEKDTFWKDAYNAPERLQPTWDVQEVWRRWKSGLMDEDVRPSYDAGRYLCEFLFYSCLVEYWRRDRNGKRPCAFLHVPADDSEAGIRTGVRVTLGLIVALVGSEIVDEDVSRKAMPITTN